MVLFSLDGISNESTNESEERMLYQADVSLSIYWQRHVAFDEKGRAQRSARSELTWHHKLVQDMLGIYHIGVVVHGVEYSFGNSHAPHSQQLGGRVGGVVRHVPSQAGPHNVFKQSVPMGSICVTADHVSRIAEHLSLTHFGCKSYNRFQHNCADFAAEFCSQLGVKNELPSWCRRGSAAAKLMGLGREESQTTFPSDPPQWQDHHVPCPAVGVPSNMHDADTLAELMMMRNYTKGIERPTLLTSHAFGPRLLKCQKDPPAVCCNDFEELHVAEERFLLLDDFSED
jgi:hypothetical protein